MTPECSLKMFTKKNRLMYLISVKIHRTSLVCLLVAPQQPTPGLVMPRH